MLSKRLFLMVMAVVVSLAIISAGAAAVGVRPLVIDLDLKPGDVGQFELVLSPGTAAEVVHLSLYQPVQLVDGSLEYHPGDPEIFPALSWISLDQTVVNVYPGSEAKVSGTVRVPFSAGGSHTAVIMVEPQVPMVQSGITFRVRYAVSLNIRVDRPGLRRTAELVEFDLAADETGQPVIRGLIHNLSQWDYLVTGEAAIRDSERRLVERIPLTSLTGLESGLESVRIFPGAVVEFSGPVTKRLEPGEYNIRMFIRYGDTGQIIKTENMVIAPGDFVFSDDDDLGAVSFDLDQIALELNAGGRRSQPLLVSNELGRSIKVVVGLEEVERDYPYSLIEWIQLSNAEEIVLPPRGNRRIVVTTAVPRDAETASYHGVLAVAAFDAETEDFLGLISIPVSVLVGGEHEYNLEVRSLGSALYEDDLHLISLDLANTGNVPLNPEVTLVIYNDAGEFIARAELALPEGSANILPLRSSTVEGLASGLEAGRYLAQLSILLDNNEELSFERELVIE